MVGKDYIDLKTLTMDELAGVVHLYPWFGSARKELCERMSRLGGGSWGEDQYAGEALYVADRGRLAAYARAGQEADCSDKDPKNCEIYIVEGDSAGGSAKSARQRQTQAILPLRGKILNVEKEREDRIYANEEIKAMLRRLQKMKEARTLADELASEMNLDVKIEMTISSLSESPMYYTFNGIEDRNQ